MPHVAREGTGAPWVPLSVPEPSIPASTLSACSALSGFVRVSGFGFRVQSLGFGVRVQGLRFGV